MSYVRLRCPLRLVAIAGTGVWVYGCAVCVLFGIECKVNLSVVSFSFVSYVSSGFELLSLSYP